MATVGTVAQFVCPIGTTVNGDSVILCKNDGHWSGPVPNCQPLGEQNLCYNMQKFISTKVLEIDVQSF